MMRRWSLRTRFVLFATACLIPLLAVVLFFLDRGIQRNTDQIVNSENTIASLSSQNMSTYLNGVVDMLDKLAARPEIVGLNQDDSKNTLGLTRDVRTDLSGLLLVDAKGNLISTSGPAASQLDAIKGQISLTIESGQPAVSKPIQDTDDHAVMLITVPVTTLSDGSMNASPNASTTPTPTPTPAAPGAASTAAEQAATGTNVGAIVAVVNLNYLESLVVPYARGRTEIAVAGKDGVIVSTAGIQKNIPQFLKSQSDQIGQALEGDSGNFTTKDADGRQRLAVFAPVQSDVTHWAVIVTNPTPRASAQTLIYQSVIVLCLAGLVILALAVVFGEFTARPLRTLAQRAASMQTGDFSVNIEPVGGGEVRTLSTALADMGDQLAAQVHGLEESHRDRDRQANQMRDLLRRTLRLQEDERRRIAGEIHDAVSPLITGALYQARALQMTNGHTEPEAREESLESVNKLLEQASEELHGVIFDLRPPDLDDLGVVAAIEAFIQTMQRTGLKCRLETGAEPSLTPEVRLGIYRIVQEALHNVVRHASADEAVVRLESIGDGIRVTVRDNGTGFDPTASVRPTSLGLLSMRERAAAIGASFTIVSKPGGGTAIVIERADTDSVMSDRVLADLMRESAPGDEAEDDVDVAEDEFQDDAHASDPASRAQQESKAS